MEATRSPSSTLRAEVISNLRLALPLITAQLAGVGMGAVDTVFSGRLGAEALAAVAMGFNLQIVFYVFFMGLYMACSSIVAHMVGAGRPAFAVAGFVRRARHLALSTALVWIVLMNLVAGPVLTHLGLSAASAALAVKFVRWLSLSAFGMSLWFAQRFSAEGLGWTSPIVVAGLLGLGVNGVLDWLLLFPHPRLNAWGWPVMGSPGCGVATTLASLSMAAVLAWSLRRDPRMRTREAVGGPAAPVEGARDILRLGLPIGLIMLAEAGLFVAVALLMAGFGDVPVAAYQVAINFVALVFMIPVGISMATTVRVGQALGGGQRARARRAGLVGMGLGLINAASNASIMLLAGSWIAGVYSDDASIVALAAHFLVLAAIFQFFDGLQATANGALRGFKDTRLPALITLFAYWAVGLPVACGLAFVAGMGVSGLWWGLTAGLGVAALGLCWRYHIAATQ